MFLEEVTLLDWVDYSFGSKLTHSLPAAHSTPSVLQVSPPAALPVGFLLWPSWLSTSMQRLSNSYLFSLSNLVFLFLDSHFPGIRTLGRSLLFVPCLDLVSSYASTRHIVSIDNAEERVHSQKVN